MSHSNIYDNLRKGIVGEELVSRALTELHVFHCHNAFGSIQEYSRTMNYGPDIWDDEDFIQIEVKYWPNSWLDEVVYDEKIRPRFNNSAKVKICVVIGETRIPKEAYSWASDDDIRLVHIKDETSLLDVKTELNYILTVSGYWNRSITLLPLTNMILYPLPCTTIPILANIFEHKQPKNPLLGDNGVGKPPPNPIVNTQSTPFPEPIPVEPSVLEDDNDDNPVLLTRAAVTETPMNMIGMVTCSYTNHVPECSRYPV